MTSSLVSILIPVYNNAMHLRELHQRAVTALEAAGRRFELLLVNDGSRDDSWSVLAELAQADVRVKALCLSRNFGQHAAISAALEHARGEQFILMDADLQDRPEHIPVLLDKLDAGGHDIVYTLKVGGEDGALRKLTSRAFHGFLSRTTRSQDVVDVGTFRAFNRRVADALLQYRERAVVYGPLMHTMGFDSAFVPVPRDPRQGSRSSYSFLTRLGLAMRSLVSYSSLPQRVLLGAGATISAASLIYLLVVLVQYLTGGPGLAQGLTLLVVLLLFLIGLMMVSMGVLAYYLLVIYREVLDRPRYHVQQSRNLEGKP